MKVEQWKLNFKMQSKQHQKVTTIKKVLQGSPLVHSVASVAYADRSNSQSFPQPPHHSLSTAATFPSTP